MTSFAFSLAFAFLHIAGLWISSRAMLTARTWTLSLSWALRRSSIPIPAGILRLPSIRRVARWRRLTIGVLCCNILVVPVHAVLPMLSTSRTVDIVPLDHASTIDALPSRALLCRHFCRDETKESRISWVMLAQAVLDPEQTSRVQSKKATTMQVEAPSGPCSSSARSTPLPSQSRGERSPRQGTKQGWWRWTVPDTYTRIPR